MIPQAASRLGALSLGIAIVLIATYACGLLFTLVTHREVFAAEPAAAAGSGPGGLGPPLLRLGLATLGTAWMSDVLVG